MQTRVHTHIWCPPCLSFHRVLCPHVYSTPPPQQPEQQSSLLSDLQPSEWGWPQPVQPRVALPVYCVGADTGTGSQRPIQSLAYEISSSAMIPYTSSAYSHIQNPVYTSCLCEIEGKLGTDKLGVFSLVFKRFLSLDLGNLPRGSRTPCTKLLRLGGISNETSISW